LRPKIALVTSGVGTAQGGIGVVAKLIVSALQKDTDVSVWQHPASLPRPLRVGLVGGRVFLGSRKCPDLVVYDHVHQPSFKNQVLVRTGYPPPADGDYRAEIGGASPQDRRTSPENCCRHR
jgi:hypothetical protein